MQDKNNVIPQIESRYESFTSVEKNIADYFIHMTDEDDLSAQAVCEKLFVSAPSLTRFSKKCGYSGYREFLFHYNQRVDNLQDPNDLQTKTVLNTYQELLDKSYALIDEEQMQRVANLLINKKLVYIYGMGSSGLLADEMQIRFMRLGIRIEAITDSHILRMHSVLLDQNCLVIGLSISGKTFEVTNGLREAAKAGATTILMTSVDDDSFLQYCDEVMLVAVKENLEYSRAISPQFPIMIMVDILFSKIMEIDSFKRQALHTYTLTKILKTEKNTD